MKTHETVHWHGLQIAEAVELLDTDPIARDAMLADRCNVVFAGTLRLIGVAFGVSMVVAFEKRLRARAETGRGSGHALEPAAHRI